MLPSSGRSIGEQSVTTLPANRSIILADSRFRKENDLDDPYNFNCDLSGTAIYAKEIYYQKLFWNQPIFSHNNESVELRFQMNGDTSITYVVYALPFVMFQQYDGNAPGSSLLTPNPYSYAAMMEAGLNGDIRTIPLNTTLINFGLGKVLDPNDGITPIVIRFRYSPTRGFCVYPVQASPTPGFYYSIKFLPCSYIDKGHYVHGFGFFNPNHLSNQDAYIPHDFFSASIWSDCTPNLLPTRYIVIQSPELNKDRRLISFHNGNSANFVNELGIFSINPARTGVFHEVGVGDDATVISLRDDYTPQTFRIQILDEYGNGIRCSDNFTALLQSPGIDPSVIQSYMNGDTTGRGNSLFIDYLVFGYQRFFDNSVPLGGEITLNLLAVPSGMKNQELVYQYFDPTTPDSLNMSDVVTLVLTDAGIVPSPQGLGFNPNTSNTVSYIPRLPNTASFTIFTWYPLLNPFPTLRWDWQFETLTITAGGGGKSSFVFVMFDALTFQPIMFSQTLVTMKLPGNTSSHLVNSGIYAQSWTRNPSYNFPTSPTTLQVGFGIAWVGNNPTYRGTWFTMYGPSMPSPPWPQAVLQNIDNISNTQVDYLPPNVNPEYDFGDPLAIALCEEVIHEIAAILEYN